MSEQNAHEGGSEAEIVPRALEAIRVGRPPLPAAVRRSVLLDAAGRVFMNKGFNTATVEAIAAEAGMSKKTVYKVFDSKLALFDALIADRFFSIPEPPVAPDESLEESLTGILLTIADTILRPDRVDLLRLIVCDGQAAPEVTTAFERIKMRGGLNRLEQWFARQETCGALKVGNIVEAARLVFGMTIAEPTLLVLLKAPRAAQALPDRQRIAQAVAIFLRGLTQGSLA